MTRSCASSCPVGVSRVMTRTCWSVGLENVCTVPGGTTIDSPGPRWRTACPTRTHSLPSTTSNVSSSTRCQWAGGPDSPEGTRNGTAAYLALFPPFVVLELRRRVGDANPNHARAPEVGPRQAPTGHRQRAGRVGLGCRPPGTHLDDKPKGHQVRSAQGDRQDGRSPAAATTSSRVSISQVFGWDENARFAGCDLRGDVSRLLEAAHERRKLISGASQNREQVVDEAGHDAGMSAQHEHKAYEDDPADSPAHDYRSCDAAWIPPLAAIRTA